MSETNTPKTKPLYILVNDLGDGSFYPLYTMNKELIHRLQEAYDKDLMTYENGIGCDGDGFHYETINIPVECTPESLGIRVINDDYADSFFNSD